MNKLSKLLKEPELKMCVNGHYHICNRYEKQMSECDREAMERSQRQWGDVCIFYSRKNCRYDK